MIELLGLALALASFAITASAFRFARREFAALVPVVQKPLSTPLLVVIPARNEGKRIGSTLAALLKTNVGEWGSLEILVVDDRSSDDTGAVVDALSNARGLPARVHRLSLLDDPPDDATFGKPRALRAAVEHARAGGALTERVLFLDADVTLAPGALGALVDVAEKTGADAVSGVPALECASAVEQLLVPTLVSVVTRPFAPSKVHDENDPAAFLNGQILLVRSAALDDAGGWRAVERSVLEDVALARVLKARGNKLRLADLRTVASTRMYESFAGIVDGFGKNATALLGDRTGLIGVLAFVTSLLPASALGCAALSALDASSTTTWSSALDVVTGVTAALVAGVVALQVATRIRAGSPLWPVLVLPLVYLGVAFVLVRASMARTITWRGRVYPR